MGQVVWLRRELKEDEDDPLFIASDDIGIVPNQCPLAPAKEARYERSHDDEAHFTAFILAIIIGLVCGTAWIWHILSRGHL